MVLVLVVLVLLVEQRLRAGALLVQEIDWRCGGGRWWPGGLFSSCADNEVGASGVAMLAEALQQNSTLTLLDLKCA